MQLIRLKREPGRAPKAEVREARGDPRSGGERYGWFLANTPIVGAEGVDVFVLRDVKGLHQRLGEVGERGGGFGFDLTLSDRGKEAAQSRTKVTSGYEATREKISNVLGDLLAGEGLCFLAGVKGAEIGMAFAARHTALAPIGKRERTQGRTVLGAIGGHRSLQKVKFWDFGEVSRRRGALLY
jgi:hypothetical protein